MRTRKPISKFGAHLLIALICLQLLQLCQAAILSPQILTPIAHGKPWSGPEQQKADRKLDLAGRTGWQKYENIDSEADATLRLELIVTLETDRDWLVTDAPSWFLAIPSDLDDPEGVRDYIIIKGRYLIE